MRIVLVILIPPILIFGCALATMWLPLPQPFPSPFSSARNQVAAVMTGILGIGYLIGLALYLIASFRQAGRALNPGFTSRGLSAKSYLGFGQQYQGLVQGRQVQVYFMPPQGFNPALLNIYVTANLDVRVAIGKQRPLLDCRDCPLVNVDGLNLSDLQVYAQESVWARELLAKPTSSAALSRLMSNQEEYGLREVYIQPGRIWLSARPSSRVSELYIQQWFDDLLTLAETAEQQDN